MYPKSRTSSAAITLLYTYNLNKGTLFILNTPPFAMPPTSLSVNFLYNKSNTFGLSDDIVVIERLLKAVSGAKGSSVSFQKPRHTDIREPFAPADLQIHLEIPVFAAIPWSFANIMLVNAEHWKPAAYNAYVHAFDLFLLRDHASAAWFRDVCPEASDRIAVVPWCSSWDVQDLPAVLKRNEFVSFLGGSTNKTEYMKQLIPYWRASYPPLTIYTTREEVAMNLKELASRSPAASSLTVICTDLDVVKQKKIAASYGGHVVVSRGEAYGYAAAHAEVAGAFTIMNRLPAFEEYYSQETPETGVAWLSAQSPQNEVIYPLMDPLPGIQEELDAAVLTFVAAPAAAIVSHRTSVAKGRFAKLVESVQTLIEALVLLVKERRPAKGIVHLPPILDLVDCPPITVITPTYNRKKLFDIAFHNMLSTDYPLKKIEWIIIEDNEKAPHMIGEKIMAFQIQVPDLTIKYIPIEGRMTIGEKRNHAMENATNDIVLFMDDDDHYPITSFRRRVAWLTKGKKAGQPASIACCTTIALYDLIHGTSAVNVPPMDIPLAQRISEATLTFHKAAWEERKFPAVSLAEGEEWIKGREQEVIEIPPQQIIVAFSHGQNQSSRRIPPTDQAPSCFWGFPREYLIFIHGLVGVEIEEDTSSKRAGRK